MSLDWHNPTSRSKQFGFFVFLILIPVISFLLGSEYNETIRTYENTTPLTIENTSSFEISDTVLEEDVVNASVATATVLYKGNVFTSKKFGFTLELPRDWKMTSVPIQEKNGDGYSDTEMLYSFEKGKMVILPNASLKEDPFCSQNITKLQAYTGMMSIDKVIKSRVVTRDDIALDFYRYSIPLGSHMVNSYIICSREIGLIFEGDISFEMVQNVGASLRLIAHE